MANQIHNINVIAKETLPSPKTIKAILPLTESARETVINSRNALVSILDRKDKRLIVVVGPCSIHDLDAAKDCFGICVFSRVVSYNILPFGCVAYSA